MTIKPVVLGVKKLTPTKMRHCGPILRIVLCVAAICSGPSATAQGIQQPPVGFPESLDRYIEQAMRDWEVPGLAIAIVRNDSVLVAKGFGVRELGKPERVDANTVFNIASLTKSFTTTAAAMLVDEGKVSWDAPAKQYLPGLEFSNPYLTAEVSMRDLLSHRTGLHGSNMMWVLTDISRPEIIRRARYLQPDRPFRTEEIYSNVGFTIAGEALAAAAHTSYEDLIRQRIFAPLGMRSTTISMADLARQTNKVSPHAVIGGAQRAFPWRDIDIIAPAGAINSTANDMATWLRFQMGDGAFAGKRLVSAAQLAETHSPQTIFRVTPAMKRGRQVQGWPGYGLGWNIMDYRGRQMVWHGGNGDGQPALMTIFPDDRLGIIVMLNTWVAGNLHLLLTNRIADTYLGFPARDWSGELLPKKAQIRGDGQALAALQPLRNPNVPASHNLAAYTGTYVDSLYGEQTVRLSDGHLTVQMGGPKGQIADLSQWNGDTFVTMWRDPLFREVFPSVVEFSAASHGAINGLVMHINRDHIASHRIGQK
ncbi:MAG: serine hydrolase [Actinomycetota bacterium]|nr:serine hydrolase [Actinomycetota bacterium]